MSNEKPLSDKEIFDKAIKIIVERRPDLTDFGKEEVFRVIKKDQVELINLVLELKDEQFKTKIDERIAEFEKEIKENGGRKCFEKYDEQIKNNERANERRRAQNSGRNNKLYGKT